jgi:hypothetical protein
VPIVKRHIVAVLALAALSGCAGGGGSAGFADPCPAVTGVTDPLATLTAPAKGATGVSTTIGTVSFTVSNADLQTGIFQLIATSPPNATPVVFRPPITAGAGGVLSVAIPVLQSRTTYDASIQAFPAIPGTSCRGQVSADLGTFTTQ